MTEQLKQAAQQALEAWQRAKYAQPQQDPAIAYAMQMVDDALTQRPAAQAGEREAFESVLIDGAAYDVPAPVAAELLWLHIELQARASLPTQPAAHSGEPYVWLIESTKDKLSELEHNALTRLIYDYRFACNEWEESDKLRLLERQARAQAKPDVPETDFGKMATPEPLPEHADHVTEIASRLRLVARLAGVAEAVPADDLTAVGCIFSVLGNMRRALELKQATPEPVGDVFGYFRALPFGWEQCSEHDEGAVALYDHPAPGVPEGC